MSWTDRKHWEIRIGRWSLSRWHPGAPCRLVSGQRHPITLVRTNSGSNPLAVDRG